MGIKIEDIKPQKYNLIYDEANRNLLSANVDFQTKNIVFTAGRLFDENPFESDNLTDAIEHYNKL